MEVEGKGEGVVNAREEGEVCECVYLGWCGTFNRSHSLVLRARNLAYTKENILGAFAGTGIYPYNPRKDIPTDSSTITHAEPP